MKTKFLRTLAVALGLGITGSAEAQYGSGPAAGSAAGVHVSTVPVHPSLQQPPQSSSWPLAGNQTQAVAPGRSAPQWSRGQAGFAMPTRLHAPGRGNAPWQDSVAGLPSFAAQPQYYPQRQPNAPQPNAPQPNAPQPNYSQPSYPQTEQSSGTPAQFAVQPRRLPQTYHAASVQKANPATPLSDSAGVAASEESSKSAVPVESPSPSPGGASSSNDGRPASGPPAPPPGHPPMPADPPQAQLGDAVPVGSGVCSTCSPHPVGSYFQRAAAAPWQGRFPSSFGLPRLCGPNGCGPAPPPVPYGPVPLRTWFAGGDVLFLTTEQDGDARLLYDAGHPGPTLLSSRDVDPDSEAGFDVFLGRYINGGRHAVTVNYFYFNPEEETALANQPGAGVGPSGNPYDYQVPRLNWNNISFDVGADGNAGNDETVHERYDAAIGFRVRRDVSFQGIEANLVSFGLGGAQRGGIGPLAGPCGSGCGPEPGCAGAMIPGCDSNLQIRTTHGLRWFQFKDTFQFASSQTDYVYGIASDDMYYDIGTRNNLYGYQFGARFDYALGCRVNVHAGSKFGIYANDAEFRSRIGTTSLPAYVNDAYPPMAGRSVESEASHRVLATLGELDLGGEYRLNGCWTLRGGYRLYGLTGIATTVDSIADDPGHLPSARQFRADDSIFLHGGYVGVDYNW